MVSISNIATRILDTNGYQLTDLPKKADGTTCTLTVVEYLIDDAIDYINLRLDPEGDGPMSSLSGDAESKMLNGTKAQLFCVKQAMSLLLRAFKDKGPNTSLASLSVSQIISDPHFVIINKALEMAIKELRKGFREVEVSAG